MDTLKEKIKNGPFNVANWGLSVPDKKETAVNTGVVIAAIAAISACIFCMDSLYAFILQIIV